MNYQDVEFKDQPINLQLASHYLSFMQRVESTNLLCVGCGISRVWKREELCILSFQPNPEIDAGAAKLVCIACSDHPQRRMKAMQIIEKEARSRLKAMKK